MLILRCSRKLWLLEGMLRKKLPESLPVYGAVMHMNRGNPAGHEVLMDSWPEFKIVLTRPCRQVACDPGDYFANLYSTFYQEEEACWEMLWNSDAVDWSQASQICGLQDGLYKAVRDLTRDKGLNMNKYAFQTFLHPDPPAMPQHQPRKGFTLAQVSPTHAKLLNDTWHYWNSSWSLRYMDTLIRLFPNTCLLDPEGNPVSWILSDLFGCGAHGYTLPAYRQQGHVSCVMGPLVAQVHARGFPVYTTVLPENEPSRRLLLCFGFHIQPGLFYRLMVTPRPTQAETTSTLESAQQPAPSCRG